MTMSHLKTTFTYEISIVIYFTLCFTYIKTEISEQENLACDNRLDAGANIMCNDHESLNTWANNLPILKIQDRNIVNHMKDLVRQQETNPLLSEDTVIDHFQRILALPLQTACHVGKWVSLKRWLYNCGSTDGERYLCMDNFYKDIPEQKCVIYSFGIADDFTFEREMGSLGCIVHAYDPTVNLTSYPAKNVHFKKLGLGHLKGKMKMTINYDNNRLSEPLPTTTLKDAIVSNGDLGKEITYLKIDIESSEIKAIPEWIKSGVLKNVRQIGIELHTGKVFFNDKIKQARAAKSLLRAISKLHDLGFRHISYSPNTCVGKSQDSGGQYYTFADIVLFRPYPSDK